MIFSLISSILGDIEKKTIAGNETYHDFWREIISEQSLQKVFEDLERRNI